jgi:peroxiredoxin
LLKQTKIAFFFAGILLVASVGASEQSKKKSALLEEQVLTQMKMGADLELIFRDAKKEVISRADFFEGVFQGRAFQVIKTDKKATLMWNEESASKRVDVNVPALHIGRGYKLKRDEEFPMDGMKTLDGVVFARGTATQKFTLINFYYADCPPCVHEVKELNRITSANPDVRAVAITSDTAEVSRAFVASTGLTWPILPNANVMLKTLGVQGFPAFALLDKDGKLKAMGNHVELGFAPGGLDAWLKRAMLAN